MKKRHLAGPIALLVCSACSQALPSQSLNQLMAPSPSTASSAATSTLSARVPVNFRAHLSGDPVIPALPLATRAQGEAILQLSRDATELSYRVIASNIDNVTAAHIHIGAVGARGPLAAFLFGPGVPPGGGRTDGVLATGTLTDADFPGVLKFADLVREIAAGNAYVDVPTSDGVAPPNTGPGDYIGGEIRGQLR